MLSDSHAYENLRTVKAAFGKTTDISMEMLILIMVVASQYLMMKKMRMMIVNFHFILSIDEW
jgi:hypothetical protein